MSSQWIHLVKGPATVSLEGRGQVLGKDISNNQVSVAGGKILPFEISSDCKIKIKEGSGGETWLAPNSVAGTSIWQEIIQKIFGQKIVRTILLIVGNTDTGKSTLATYILNEALKNGLRACVIDADIGQGDLAPPSVVGAATTINEQITDLREINAEFFEFIGSINPVGFEDLIIRSVSRILTKINGLFDLCIINTDGYTTMQQGMDYKILMAKKLEANVIVCLGNMSIFNRFKAYFTSSSAHVF